MNRISRIGRYEVCEYNDPRGGFHGIDIHTGEIVCESRYRAVVVRKLFNRHEKEHIECDEMLMTDEEFDAAVRKEELRDEARRSR